MLGDIPVLGPLLFQNAYITTYLGFAILAVAAIVLYKTKFGLRLRACGEHPQAADSVGINVYKMRYAGVAISGALAGIGGLVFVIPTSTQFNATVSGLWLPGAGGAHLRPVGSLPAFCLRHSSSG